jgi:hypothetical protein
VQQGESTLTVKCSRVSLPCLPAQPPLSIDRSQDFPKPQLTPIMCEAKAKHNEVGPDPSQTLVPFPGGVPHRWRGSLAPMNAPDVICLTLRAGRIQAI